MTTITHFIIEINAHSTSIFQLDSVPYVTLQVSVNIESGYNWSTQMSLIL